MKKGLIIPLATACILSLAGTALAAEENPFSTVPKKHWAYESVVKLVHDGLVDGYADGDFRGDKPATRYEMAVLTAKAMANLQKADAKDKEALEKLQKEFSSELETIGVRVKGLEKDVKGLKEQSSNIKWNGNIRVRYDWKQDKVKGADVTKTGPKDTNYYYELTGTAKISDDWTGVVRFVGVKDRTGVNRDGSGENTNGQFDITRLYVTGPVGDGKLKVGRDKASFIYGLVNNEYYTGASYSFGKLLKTTVTYGRPDHLNDDGDNGIGSEWVNPGNNKYGITGDGGVDYVALDLKYPTSKATNVYGAFFNITSSNDTYIKTQIGELAFGTDFAKNLTFRGDYAKSDRDTDNKAYVFGVTYKEADKKNPRSWELTSDYVHLESQAYLKSTYDVKDNTYGRKGYQVIFKYVPVKNMMWTTRWIYGKNINPNKGDYISEKWIRSQVEFFF